MTDSSQTTRGPLFAAALGAAGGFFFPAALILTFGDIVDWANLRWDGLHAVRWHKLPHNLFIPALAGGVAGVILACAFWVTLTTRRVPAVLLVMAWWLYGVLGGAASAIGLYQLLLVTRLVDI